MILRQYEESGYRITEYTRDGKTVSAMIKEIVSNHIIEEEPTTILEERILAETQYQTVLLELSALGGNE